MTSRVRHSLSILSMLLLICFTSCKSNSKTQPISEEEANSVLVDLKEEGDEIRLLLAFDEINLQKVKLISRPLRIFLFSFDTSKTEMDVLLNKLKQIPYVEAAQSNKKTNTRK